jgi:hypothetical protein
MGGRHGSASGGDGAEEKADRGARVGFRVLTVLQRLGDEHWVTELDQR